MALRNAMSPAQVADRVYGILLYAVETTIDVGNTVCFQLPRRAFMVYLNLQKEVLFLPVRCLSKVYEAFLQRPTMFFIQIYRRLRREEPSVVEILTGEKDPSSDKIVSSVRELRNAAMCVMNTDNVSRTQISVYKKKLESWKLENEKKTEEIYKISSEEKELMKAVASALRYLRCLKAKREKMDASFNESIANMINAGTVTAEKLFTIQKKIYSVDIAFKEKRNATLNLLSQGQSVDIGLSELMTLCKENKGHIPDILQPISDEDTIQRALGHVTDENVTLKRKIASTHDKLEEILKMSRNINHEIVQLSEKFSKMAALNGEMISLHHKFSEERELLQAAEADREHMREKLQVLECMIKEEEYFLGDVAFESGFEDTDFSSEGSVELSSPTS